jgi:hypothetical protein
MGISFNQLLSGRDTRLNVNNGYSKKGTFCFFIYQQPVIPDCNKKAECPFFLPPVYFVAAISRACADGTVNNNLETESR